jgi:hypothetical protein
MADCLFIHGPRKEIIKDLYLGRKGSHLAATIGFGDSFDVSSRRLLCFDLNFNPKNYIFYGTFYYTQHIICHKRQFKPLNFK